MGLGGSGKRELADGLSDSLQRGVNEWISIGQLDVLSSGGQRLGR